MMEVIKGKARGPDIRMHIPPGGQTKGITHAVKFSVKGVRRVLHLGGTDGAVHLTLNSNFKRKGQGRRGTLNPPSNRPRPSGSRVNGRIKMPIKLSPKSIATTTREGPRHRADNLHSNRGHNNLEGLKSESVNMEGSHNSSVTKSSGPHHGGGRGKFSMTMSSMAVVVTSVDLEADR